jgi:cyclopropane fatty-acyl-phospholipid synthase-like methyltransferase
MRDLFISKERKPSKIAGTGIQYIPGHIEPFVDLVIKNYLPPEREEILDLGGGGFVFAIPVAALNRNITVVDMDPSGLDLKLIYQRIGENGHPIIPDYNFLREKIQIEIRNIFDYLRAAKSFYPLITAFRLIHFFDEQEVDLFFHLVSERLNYHGKLILSAFTKYIEDDKVYNEIYLNSEPVKNNDFYRRFSDSNVAADIQKVQNLGSCFHVFSEDYIKGIAEKANLKLIFANLPSTRIVRGYIFEKQ